MGSPQQDLARGEHLVDTAKAVGRGLPTVGHAVTQIASKLLAPASFIGKPLLRGAGAAGRFISKSPRLTKGLLGAGILAPILTNAANTAYTRETQGLLASSQFPERTVLASLNRHFIKTSGFLSEVSSKAVEEAPGAIATGFGSALGEGALGGLFAGASMIGKRLLDSTVTNPRRERTFYEAIRTDSVLRDALKNNPAILAQLKEAFSTLVRFAPSLSEDLNAVRSYLREAVVSGAGINYATVKQLAETEKLVHERTHPGGKR